jgi:AbiV family abortive infection protein
VSIYLRLRRFGDRDLDRSICRHESSHGMNDEIADSSPEDVFRVTVANARRLWSDGRVLNLDGRAKSAILLGVLALEEFGKALIALWGAKNLASKRLHPTHIEKQAALFALLAANEMLGKAKKRLRRQIEKGEANFRTLGELSNQFAWARGGFYEQLRTFATYHDVKPVWPAELKVHVDSDLAADVLGYFQKAILATRNVKAMSLAAEIYANDLGRL